MADNAHVTQEFDSSARTGVVFFFADAYPLAFPEPTRFKAGELNTIAIPISRARYSSTLISISPKPSTWFLS